jgi:lauroyl/myristoyl acyltransferase
MRTWHGILKSPELLQDIILRSLMANTWLAWRLRALQSPDTFADWVTVGEGEVLDALTRERNRGVVLVVAHTPFNHLLQGLPLLREREFTTIRQPVPRTPAEKADGNHPSLVLQRTLQVQRAMAVLQRRGVVQVAGDGGKGAAGVDVSFHGRQRRFRTGAAELAEATNSVLVPVFTFMNVDGSIRLDFREPLQSNESSTRKRSLDLTHQFASALAGEWPKLYASVRWHVARAMLRPPEWY